jgi:imidazolonepropionase
MPRADLVIHSAAQVVTCAGPDGPRRGRALDDCGVIEDGAVAIQGETIAAVGPSADIRAAFPAHQTLDATGRIVVPGFVDPHTHLVFAGERVGEWEQKLQGVTYLDILAAGGGILSTVRATRAASFRHLLADARARLDTMLALGTTTVEIKTGYGLSLDHELEHLRVIAALAESQACDILPTLLAAHAVPPEYAGDGDGYTDLVIREIIPAAAEWHRTSIFAQRGVPLACDVFCEANAFSLDQARRILEAGQAHGMPARIHADEFNALGGAALAAELGALSADHLDVTPPEQIAALAVGNTLCVLLPAVNFHLGTAHHADARAMIEAGAAIALATDCNPGSAPVFSMPFVLALACRMYRMTPAEALNAATINAAHAAGLGDRVGSLEPGKQADLLVLGLGDLREIPYWLGGNPVETVIKRGRVVLPAPETDSL